MSTVPAQLIGGILIWEESSIPVLWYEQLYLPPGQRASEQQAVGY
jgi:hypothetical protein